MSIFLLAALLLATSVLYGRAAGRAWADDVNQIQRIRDYRVKAAELRSRKCLPVIPVLGRAADVPVERRERVADRWRMRWVLAHYAGFHCRPTDPEGIIRYVFPDATEDAAVRVAWCESRLWPYAKNRSSSASGLFQFLSSWWSAGQFDPFDPWESSRAALRASRGGTSWGPWRASYPCHQQR
jgi:hypothetical protein